MWIKHPQSGSIRKDERTWYSGDAQCSESSMGIPDGTFKPDKKFLHVSTDEVYGSLENEDEFFYERRLRMIRTARIPQAKHLRICL